MSVLPFVSIGECQDKLKLVLEKKGCKYQGISDSIPTVQNVIEKWGKRAGSLKPKRSVRACLQAKERKLS